MCVSGLKTSYFVTLFQPYSVGRRPEEYGWNSVRRGSFHRHMLQITVAVQLDKLLLDSRPFEDIPAPALALALKAKI